MAYSTDFSSNYPTKARVVCIPVTADEIHLISITLSSVLKNTSAEAEILLLAIDIDTDDVQQVFSPPIPVKIVQATYSTTNLWPSVLRELSERYTQHDIVLLRPGLVVPSGWDSRLALAAYWQPKIAVAIPLCDSASFIALLESRQPDQIHLEHIDQLLLTYSPRRHYEMPALFSGCGYLRRAALHLIEPHLAEQPSMTTGEWCIWLSQTLREKGWHTVCCDHIYVLDHDPARRQREMAAVETSDDVRFITQAHPLSGLRFTIRESLQRFTADTASARLPVQLHIAHSWGGGLDYWIKQYCENDQARDNLVLRSIGTWGAFGQRIALYRSAIVDQPLRYWELDFPIRATALTHLQYRAILEEVILAFSVEVIMISSLIGHSLDALDAGLPTVFLAHDYYPFCPAVVTYFGEVCECCPVQRLERCFAENDQNRFFRNVSATEWLSLRRRFDQLIKAESVHFVAPSPSVADHWRILVPALRDQVLTIIPHGLDFAPVRQPDPPIGERLRVVVLGSLALQKGRGLLEQIWTLIAGQVDLFLVGCGEDAETFRGQAGVTLIPHYRHEQLSDLMADIKPEVGLLLSIWPETFSYTLSELWLLGVPVVATRLGSFADRIQDGVTGFLCAPQPKAIADRLLAIAAHRDGLTPIREQLKRFRHRSVKEMVADYHALIPLPAFSAPRYFAVSAALPKASTSGDESSRALHINAQAPFDQVLREFGQYVSQKLTTTPRLRVWQKRGLMILLRMIGRTAAMASHIRVKNRKS